MIKIDSLQDFEDVLEEIKQLINETVKTLIKAQSIIDELNFVLADAEDYIHTVRTTLWEIQEKLSFENKDGGIVES